MQWRLTSQPHHQTLRQLETVQPFSIQCTTCRRSLRVTSPEAVGQILGCPKCGSMVMIEAPPGWSAGDAAQAPSIGTPLLLSASTFIPPKPSQTPQPSATPPVIAANVAGTAPAPTKATAWKDSPPSATPPGEVLSKGVGSRGGDARSVVEKSSPTPTPDSVAPPTAAVEVPPPAAETWPRWFAPGVVATVALGVAIFILRLLLQSTDAEPVNLAETSPNPAVVETPAELEPVTETPANPNDEIVASKSAQNESVADNVEPSTAKPQVPDLSETNNATPPSDPPASEAPSIAPPAAQDVPPEPMPPAATDIAKSEPKTLPEAPNDPTSAADMPPVPSLQRVPPRQVNLEVRLAEPIKAIDVRGMPLHQFLDLLSELSTIPISIDLDALEQLNRSAATPVAVQLKDKTMAEVLDAALSPLGLGYNLERGLVVVGHAQAETVKQVKYTVQDLIGDDAAKLGELAALVRQMIAPQSWQQNGGKASMAAGGIQIVVEQTPTVHYKLLVFCEKLRVARGLPIKSRYDPAKFLLTTRAAKSRDLLQRPITANFKTPQPLAGVLDWLRRSTKATVLVDHAALAEAETSVDSHCSALAEKKPLAALLDDLLTPMELTWRVVDAGTIEITTTQAASDRDEIEFYPAGNLAADVATGKTLVEQIKTQLGPQAANPQLGVVVHFDVPSKSLIVRAPQEMQSQVGEYLSDHRGK
jgi:hypothetical protein